MATRSIPVLPGYEVISRIGRGAGAVISLALDRESGRQVAIKHVVRRGPEDDRFIAQAETEYEVARGLEHQYLRRCLEIVRLRKWLKTRELFLVMEYVDGDRLEDERPSELWDTVRIFRQVAEGLHALHQYGYAHADIKPNNVILTADGRLKIIDFGQSCPIGYTKDRVQGTPDYIAPEQVQRREIDQRTDVYNLGATMYWIMTGKWYRTMVTVAPAGATRIALESERGNDPPHAVNDTIPVPLSKLVMDCCATMKEHRPRDMREVISRLDVVQHLLELDVPAGGGKGSAPEVVRPAPADDDSELDLDLEVPDLLESNAARPLIHEDDVPGLLEDLDEEADDDNIPGLADDPDTTDPPRPS